MQKDQIGTIVYRNLGISVLTPDVDCAARVIEMLNCFHIPVHLIDPAVHESPGLNPFILNSPQLCGLIISMLLKEAYDTSNTEPEEAYYQNAAHQAIQNIVLLLKAIHPRIHNGELPNLEDVLNCFVNFDLVEEMCEELKKDDTLREANQLILAYFEQNFYRDSDGRREMKRFIHFAAAQLDYLLRTTDIKKILCDRQTNLMYKDVLEKGECVVCCTRAPDIGGLPHKGLRKILYLLSSSNGRRQSWIWFRT